MRRTVSYLTATVVLVSLLASTGWLALARTEGDKALDANKIGQAAGTKATTAPDGVVRLAWARTDVPVKIDGTTWKPFGGLGSWAAFKATSHGAMVMGDTVVFQDEVTPAIDAAFANGLEVTALHNHFFFDEPKVYFMHIGGSGDPEKLAAGVKSVWDAIKAVRAKQATPATQFTGAMPKDGKLNAAELDKVFGTKNESQDGVIKYTIARKGKMHGVEVGGSMGLTTWAAFAGSDESAAVAGDFIMAGPEVQTVLKTLRKHNLHIVALHNHMAGEEPAFYFTHFWGKGKAADLAGGIKAALDAQKAATGKH